MRPPRVLLFTGPPGAGTSTLAASAALRAADGGARTLLVTSAARHPLADLHAGPPTDGPVAVGPRLWVLADGAEAAPGARPVPSPPVRADAARVLTALAPPGAAEATWDVLVVEGRLGVVSAALDRLAAQGVPDDGRVHLVVDPPRTSIAEATRLAAGWSLEGHRPHALLLNRPPVDGSVRRWLDTWRAAEAELPEGLRATWSPVEVHRIPAVPPELRGAARLRALAPHVAPAVDAAEPARRARPAGRPGPTIAIARAGAGYELVVDVPFVERGEVEVARQGPVLHLSVAGHRRLLHLPDSLRRRPVAAATLRDGRLVVRFADAAAAGGADRPRSADRAGPLAPRAG